MSARPSNVLHQQVRMPAQGGGLTGKIPRAVARAMADDRFRLTLSFAGLTVYLWVIHSAKAQIGAEAIAAGLFGLLFLPRAITIPRSLWWFAAFIAWATIGWSQSLYPAITADRLEEFGKLWLIFLVAANVAHSRRDLTMFIIVWLGIFALYPVRGILFNVMIGSSTQGRYAWNFIFSNPNDLATLTLPMLAMAIAVLQSPQTRWVRLSALAGTIVLPFVIFATQSRGGILALATLALLILVQHRQRFRTFAIVFVAGGVIALMAPPDVWIRLANLKNVTSEATIAEGDRWGSAQQRYEIWRVGRAVAKDHLLFGTGLGTYPKVHASYAQQGGFNPMARGERDSHSTYLNVVAETGLVGGALLLGMLASIFMTGRRVIRELTPTDPVLANQIRTLLVGLVAFLQACVFATMHHIAFLYLYLAVIATAIAVARRQLLPARPDRGPTASPARPLMVRGR